MVPPPKPSSTKRRTNHNRKPPTTLSPLISAITTAITSSHTFLHNNDLHLLPSHSLSLHSSLSSAYLSLSKLQPHLHLRVPHLPPSSPPWFHRFLRNDDVENNNNNNNNNNNTNNDPRWIDFFRMSKPTFNLLTSSLSNSLSSSLSPSIPADVAVGCALYKLAHNASFSFVGKKFGLSTEDACKVFYVVCKLICDELGWLLGGYSGGLSGFEKLSLINCCGALGVEKFELEGGEVLGKDGCLIVQALVDSEGRFLDVSAGWPSMFSVDKILRQTRLFASVEESKELLNGPKVEVVGGSLVGQYVLGECCYPCLPWLLTPFSRRGEEVREDEKEFNEVHRKAMRCVRMAFGRVRGNWKLVNRRWKEDTVEFLPFVIVTACVLNNFLMKHVEMLSDNDGGSGCVREEGVPVYDGEVDEGAARNRELLALHLHRSRVKQDS